MLDQYCVDIFGLWSQVESQRRGIFKHSELWLSIAWYGGVRDLYGHRCPVAKGTNLLDKTSINPIIRAAVVCRADGCAGR